MSDLDLRRGRTKGAERQDEKKKTLTLKGVEEDTFNLTKEAARKSGLKVSTWVRMQLREAAERALGEDTGPAIDPVLLREMAQQLSKISEDQKLERERIEKIRDEIRDVIRAQHGMMSKLLAAD